MKMPPLEYALLAIDSLLFILAWKTFLGEKKNIFQLVFIILLILILGIISVFIWNNANLPFFSDLNGSTTWNIQDIWVFVLGFAIIMTAFSSFKKDMPPFLIIFASLIGGGLILHVVLNEWIAQTNYSPFLRIAMLFAYPVLISYPLVQLALINKQRSKQNQEEKKNRIYNPGIEIKNNSILEQKMMQKTQPSGTGKSILQTEPNKKLETFSITNFLDNFIDTKDEAFKSKEVEINAFYQGLDFQVSYDEAEFKAAFESFFSFLEIICDREYQVNIALGEVSDIELVQIDINSSEEKIEELNDQLFIAGQRFDELNIQNDYSIESPTLLRMQLAL